MVSIWKFSFCHSGLVSTMVYINQAHNSRIMMMAIATSTNITTVTHKTIIVITILYTFIIIQGDRKYTDNA